jgi:hypothetical protein
MLNLEAVVETVVVLMALLISSNETKASKKVSALLMMDELNEPVWPQPTTSTRSSDFLTVLF